MGLALTVEIPEGLPKIEADFEALCRVIRGLVDNAIKYTPEGGRVIVSARIDGDNVAMSVEDNGGGIYPDDFDVLPKILSSAIYAVRKRLKPNNASATAAPGVGLGLYLAKHIVEQMGGQITVESEVCARTIFTVLIPALIPRRQCRDYRQGEC